MMHDQHLVSEGWADYELLDSGEGMKLERFGQIFLARPETQALWGKRRPELWKDAHATFATHEGKGAWEKHKEMAESWEMSQGPTRFSTRLTSFKHVGIFPEQEPNWMWVEDKVKGLKDFVSPTSDVGLTKSYIPNVLNLFGYTGIASLAAAHSGAKVTHVDASKTALDWAHENARLSGLPDDAVRWILDDALAFARREARRGAKYDGIILDPPAFGRGPKGEVWHIEENLPALLDALRELLVETPGAFFLVSGYAAGYAPRSLAQALESAFGEVNGESGELHIRESGDDRPTSPRLRGTGVVPSGIYARFVR
ncbi:MAG: class I SAM-dependent methyltransferase [bacterium]|nr:class I SAM-dependent methyltransferase [bacterium]